jgi:hypothetical protein
MHSPGSSGKGAGPALEPVFGAGPAADPGYLTTLRARTYLGRLRLMMLALAAAPVLILVIVPFMVREGHSRLGDVPWWVYLPPAAAALVAVLVAPRGPRPLPPGGDPLQTAGAALTLFRQAVLLRFALSEAVILVGIPPALIARSELPFLVAFVLGYPLLLRLALPTRGLVERIRRRLEAAGAESHLWAALLSPSPTMIPPA